MLFISSLYLFGNLRNWQCTEEVDGVASNFELERALNLLLRHDFLETSPALHHEVFHQNTILKSEVYIKNIFLIEIIN